MITVVINLSKEAWNGAKSLHELVYPNDDLVRRYVSNYTMNIVDYHDYDSFEKLSTGVRKIFEVLKCSGDSKAMERLVALDSSYESMDDETADFVEEIADLKIKKDEGGRRNMCKAIEDMRKAAMVKGEEIGIRKERRRNKAIVDAKNRELTRKDEVIAGMMEEIERLRTRLAKSEG